MPVHTTAPVTARDHFVVAFTIEELRARIEAFRDLSIPDEEIRRRYFQRTRSARYQSGDTRGWKLADARQIVAADRDWPQKIVRCLYRPFDWRYVFWHPAMIDWPRAEITGHLIEEGLRDGVKQRQRDIDFESLRPSVVPSLPLCLIARRQQLPTQPCTFFWISDCLALDGVIRSDNRGSESLFPLYVHEGGEWHANFTPGFIDQFASATGSNWLPHGSGDGVESFGSEDLLAYIYALFHSPNYREKYAEALRTDFPRIVVPSTSHSFGAMIRLGRELINLHLLRSLPAPSPALPVSPSLASFRAGGYFALRKWLQPKHRSAADLEYAQIAAAISRTIEIMAEIDQAVEQNGGFARAFGTQSAV
jgi:predicted helicase